MGAAILAGATIGILSAVPPTQNCGYYTNSYGHTVSRPCGNWRDHSAPAPKSATAECRDGTYSFSEHHRGTCSHHGGVSGYR